MFSEGMYGLGGGIMNMRRPPNWRKRILPRVPFSSYEAAHSTSPVVEARTQHTPMAGKKGLNWEEISEVMAEMQIMEGEVIPGGKYGRAEEYAALPFDQTPEQKKKREERQSMFRFLA